MTDFMRTIRHVGATCRMLVSYSGKSNNFTRKLYHDNLSYSRVITYLLNGLGSSYEAFITSVTTRAETISSHELYQLLLIHESRASHQNKSITSSLEPSINLSVARNRGRGFSHSGGQGRGRGRHFHNNRGGCLSPSSFSSQQQYSSHRPTCQYSGSYSIRVGDGSGISIHNFGDSCFSSSSSSFFVQNLLHVPDITKNLVFVLHFCIDNSCYFEFHSSHFNVKDNKIKKVLLTGPTPNGLYVFPSKLIQPSSPTTHLGE
ncbi:hypothetical protein F2P56_015940 [Juglans regia]|uniref:Uncharacterized protein LOC109006644 n=2 Tax=Juglans regia TaxID=51240 RepID=A0A2I4GCA0_JUGRE|nr:uncharacterized protein LOC109006644 [Juglans regia]KAF5465978.1 hypothetical protein F2P56_015940 [Juglans regia]